MNKYQEALLKVINTFNDIQLGFEYSAKEFTICTTILKELVDKETPKTVNYISDGYADGYPVYDIALCSNCERIFEVYDEEHYKYCPSCGQKIDWSDEK